MKKINIITFLLLAVCLLSCQKNKFEHVDLSNIRTNFVFQNFDSDLFALDSIGDSDIRKLQSQYPGILPLFTTEVIRIGYPEDKGVIGLLNSFVNDTTMRATKSLVDERINKEQLKEQLDKAFKYYHHYFPDKTIPKVFTCISGFNQSIVMTDSLLGIGVDKYLGRDCPYYPRLGISNYQQMNMYPQKILSDAIYAWSTVQFPFVGYGHQLIDKMIYEGKLQYMLEATLPELADSVRIGFTQKQLDFCKKNEGDMWRYLAENKMLFSTNRMDIIRYTGDAPYTSSFSAESPGRTGCWLGWQIVKSYMEHNPDVTLAQLMADKKTKLILNNSAYQAKS
ncbi:MAG: hypothetical protein ACK5MI_10030 [Mangrovibacterium sp.]